MISDEMRELLSAYVDGELRAADAARVEELSKRDPELGREIDAYRTLRRKLREWDEAEHGAATPAGFVSRVAARARAMDGALRGRGRGPSVLRPLAVAAALLLAAMAGLFAARFRSPGPPPVPAREVAFAPGPLAPAPDLALPGSALVPPGEPPSPTVFSRVHDHIPSRRALDLLEAMRREEEAFRAPPPDAERPGAEADGPAAQPGRRTAPPLDAGIVALTDGYEVVAAPSEALVLLERPPELRRPFAVGAAPSGRRLALDANSGEGLIDEDLLDVPHDVLAPLGEVWAGPRDAGRRTRVVARTNLIPARGGRLTRVVWADDLEPPRSSAPLEVQEFILGPKARQRLLAARPGPDPAFRDWLAATYGKPLGDVFKEGAKERERAVNRLVDALAKDAKATGFAVLDAKGRLLGVELFHDHALMLALAPRLLRGYLIEAKDDGIRVAPPPREHRGPETVKRFLEGLPARGLRLEKERLDPGEGMPGRLCRASIVALSGGISGHGLLVDDTPIHLTLFAG